MKKQYLFCRICSKIKFMDKERKKRIQTIKLIITEILMVIAVVAIVIILTFLAMGYNVNKDGDLAQSGLLQLKSIPTGARIEIDDEIISPKTNMSRMLPAGQHSLKLEKEGYDTWEKEITSEAGWLLKIEYPRLFLKNRTKEKVREYQEGANLISASIDGSYIVYITKDNTKLKLLNIRGDDISETEYDISKYLGEATPDRVYWNKNDDKVLISAKNGEKNEWIVFNLRDMSSSMNVTAEFKMDFSMIKFGSLSGDKLLALENGNLRSISINDKTVTQVLAENVSDFSNNDNALFYVGQKKIGEENIRGVLMYQEGNEDILLKEVADGTVVKLANHTYLGRKYLDIAEDNHLFIYRGDYPTEDFGISEMELLIDAEIAVAPEEMGVFASEQLMIARNGGAVAVFDAELSKLTEYDLESTKVFFLDNYLVGTIQDGKLYARDFDGSNKRELAEAGRFGVISKNDKWLYYDYVIDSKTNIFREKILD